jgi:hypothetical protein
MENYFLICSSKDGKFIAELKQGIPGIDDRPVVATVEYPEGPDVLWMAVEWYETMVSMFQKNSSGYFELWEAMYAGG